VLLLTSLQLHWQNLLVCNGLSIMLMQSRRRVERYIKPCLLPLSSDV
jgi:hypothetical protein